MSLFKIRNRTQAKALCTVAFFCLPSLAVSSPWLEANDPFVRSSLVLLSDAGQLSSPVNHYPLRWSMPGDDFSHVQQESSIVREANLQLLYRLNSAKLNRGNRSFKALYGSETSSAASFGQFNEDKRGLYSSVEQLNNSFSYRVSANYSEYQNDTSFNLDDSYLALNSGSWLYSIGNIDRWWGQGWQHNLILGSYAKAAPDVSVSYIGHTPGLGVWSIESLIATPSGSDYDYHSATRFVSKPLSLFEYGLTYQRWFSGLIDGSSSDQSDDQLAVDAKLTLPSIASFYHSMYVEAASTATLSELGAMLIGWTGSFPIGPHTARIVLESQQTTDEHDTTPWSGGAYPSMTDNVANTSYLLDDSTSAALYLQLHNDHQIGLIYQNATQDNSETKTQRVTYRLPALAGMVRFGADIEQQNNQDKQTNLWVGYEFRF